MGIKRPYPSRRRGDIMVYREGEDDGVLQPVAFQCCPLGVHCYCRKEIDLCRLVSLEIEHPGQASISCIGMVAACAFDASSDMYRIYVMFLDVSEEARQRLKTLSRSAGLLCPYCENF